jgi:hypothetical protein
MSKCKECNRKITPAQVAMSSCKCGYIHCLEHRLPEFHSCEKMNEIKQDNKKDLAKTLVKVEA